MTKLQAIVVLKWSLVGSYFALEYGTMLHKGVRRNCRDLWAHRDTKNGRYRLGLVGVKGATVFAIAIDGVILPHYALAVLLCITIFQVVLKRVEQVLYYLLLSTINSSALMLPALYASSHGAAAAQQQEGKAKRARSTFEGAHYTLYSLYTALYSLYTALYSLSTVLTIHCTHFTIYI
jgi:hypothetical protein